MSEISNAWQVEHKLAEVEGFGASYIRHEGRWKLYTMPGAKFFGTVEGFDRASIDFVIDALRAHHATLKASAQAARETE